MAETGLFGMGDFTHGRRAMADERPRERLGRFLRDKFRGAGAIKRLAHTIEATPKVAENAMLGHWPGDETFASIVRAFGRDVLDAVFAPEIEPVKARLIAEERDLEEKLAAVRARRRQIVGGDEGGSGGLAETSARVRKLDRRN